MSGKSSTLRTTECKWNQRNRAFCDGVNFPGVTVLRTVFPNNHYSEKNEFDSIYCLFRSAHGANFSVAAWIIILSLKMVPWLRSAHQMVYPKQWTICHAAEESEKKAPNKIQMRKRNRYLFIIALKNYTNTLINFGLMWLGAIPLFAYRMVSGGGAQKQIKSSRHFESVCRAPADFRVPLHFCEHYGKSIYSILMPFAVEPIRTCIIYFVRGTLFPV